MRIVNFCSLAPNVGNYTSVWGIEALLEAQKLRVGARYDCRQFRQVPIEDFDVALVGGAGLLHACFEGFWRWLSQQTIPVIIWGVGACINYDCVSQPVHMKSGVSVDAIRGVKERLLACNVRDWMTAEMYGLDASIGYCPTLAWVRNWCTRVEMFTVSGRVLYVHHPGLADYAEMVELMSHCDLCIENSWRGTRADVLAPYLDAEVVVTTRLHGAILANSLGKPYVALARDRKLDAYGETWGGGLVVHDVSEVELSIEAVRRVSMLPKVDHSSMVQFAGVVSGLLREVGGVGTAGRRKPGKP